MIGTALHWLYRSLSGDDPEAWPQDQTHCWLCGIACPRDTPPSQLRRIAIRDTFTDHDRAQCPESDVVCPACAYYLDHAGARGDGLILHSWLVTRAAGAVRWERERWRFDLDTLMALPAGEFLAEPLILALTTTHKKHVLPWAPVNYTAALLRVQMDAEAMCIVPADWRVVVGAFDQMRRLGHGKREIVSGQLHPVALARHGCIADALALSAQLAPWRGSLLLDLVAYVSPGGDLRAEIGGQGSNEYGS